MADDPWAAFAVKDDNDPWAKFQTGEAPVATSDPWAAFKPNQPPSESSTLFGDAQAETTLGELGAGLQRGVRQVISTAPTLAGMGVRKFEDWTGYDTRGLDEAFMETAVQIAEGGAKRGIDKVEELELLDPSTWTRYAAGTIGETVPFIASIMSGAGGAKLLAGLMAKKGVPAATRASILRSIPPEVVGAVGTATAIETAATGQELFQAEKDIYTGASLLAGSAKGALESVFPLMLAKSFGLFGGQASNLLDRIYQGTGRVGKIGVGAGVEAGTEALQEEVDIATRSYLAENYPYFSPEANSRRLNAAVAGGVGGGAFSVFANKGPEEALNESLVRQAAGDVPYLIGVGKDELPVTGPEAAIDASLSGLDATVGVANIAMLDELQSTVDIRRRGLYAAAIPGTELTFGSQDQALNDAGNAQVNQFLRLDPNKITRGDVSVSVEDLPASIADPRVDFTKQDTLKEASDNLVEAIKWKEKAAAAATKNNPETAENHLAKAAVYYRQAMNHGARVEPFPDSQLVLRDEAKHRDLMEAQDQSQLASMMTTAQLKETRTRPGGSEFYVLRKPGKGEETTGRSIDLERVRPGDVTAFPTQDLSRQVQMDQMISRKMDIGRAQAKGIRFPENMDEAGKKTLLGDFVRFLQSAGKVSRGFKKMPTAMVERFMALTDRGLRLDVMADTEVFALLRKLPHGIYQRNIDIVGPDVARSKDLRRVVRQRARRKGDARVSQKIVFTDKNVEEAFLSLHHGNAVQRFLAGDVGGGAGKPYRPGVSPIGNMIRDLLKGMRIKADVVIEIVKPGALQNKIGKQSGVRYDEKEVVLTEGGEPRGRAVIQVDPWFYSRDVDSGKIPEGQGTSPKRQSPSKKSPPGQRAWFNLTGIEGGVKQYVDDDQATAFVTDVAHEVGKIIVTHEWEAMGAAQQDLFFTAYRRERHATRGKSKLVSIARVTPHPILERTIGEQRGRHRHPFDFEEWLVSNIARWMIFQGDDAKPKITIEPDTTLTPAGPGYHNLIIKRDGKEIARANVIEKDKETSISVDGIYSATAQGGKQANTLGATDVKMILPVLRDYFPKATSVGGFRVSGANKNRVAAQDLTGVTPASKAAPPRPPTGPVEKFFQKTAGKVKVFLKGLINRTLGNTEAFKNDPLRGDPNRIVEAWMNKLMERGKVNDEEPFLSEATRRSLNASIARNEKNLKSLGLDEYVVALPERASTFRVKQLLKILPADAHADRAKLKGLLSVADRHNTMLEWVLGIHQFAEMNPHIVGLQAYKSLNRSLENTALSWASLADKRIRDVQKLGKGQADALWNLLFDLDQMVYLDRKKLDDGTERPRWPTPDELLALTQKHKLNKPAFEVYTGIRQDFLQFLSYLEEVSTQKAVETIADETALAKEVQSIAGEVAQMKARPYFPHMRFGKFIVTVRDSARKVLHFEAFYSAKDRDRAIVEIEKKYKVPQENSIESDTLSPMLQQWQGLPAFALRNIERELGLDQPDLSAQQKKDKKLLEALALQAAPVTSFRRQMLERANTPGFSMDGLRAYGTYFARAARYVARQEYTKRLEASIKDVRDSGSPITKDARSRIADYMTRHYENLMNPSADWAEARAAGYMWYFAYVPAAAFVNLTQVPMVTVPYLSSKFGDLTTMGRTVQALTDAGKEYFNELRGNTPKDEGVLSEAIEEAHESRLLDDGYAQELAAISQGSVLQRTLSTNKFSRELRRVAQWGVAPFALAEKINRAVTFRAAYKMALADNNNAHVNEVMASNKQEADQLRVDRGWDEPHLRAYMVAADAVRTTQFEYSRWARPKLMEGKRGVLLMFKSYLQNMLFFLFKQNRGAQARMLLTLMGTAGLMGLPLADDAEELTKWLLRQFGVQFDFEKMVRGLMKDWAEGISPDIVLHGASRVGFGIPAALNGLGIPSGTPDLSGSLSMGKMIPGLSPLLNPMTSSWKETVGDVTSEVAGPWLGVPFSMYQSITDHSLPADDIKRWERSMPRALRAMARSSRLMAEQRERDRGGATVVDFDPNDWSDQADILSVSLGFQPTQLSRQWDYLRAQIEVQRYWLGQRSILTEELFRAKRLKDTEGQQDAIQAIKEFNKEAPDKALRITSDTLKRSMEARARNLKMKNAGVPQQKAVRGVTRSLQELYPEAVVRREKVPK
jgi:hypothetical protein